MKRTTRNRILVALAFVWVSNSMPVLAASGKVPGSTALATPSARISSNRLIVKFRANSLVKGLSVSQINAELRRPLSAQVVGTLQAATGLNIAESHAIANGAHVMIVPAAGSTAQAVAAIAKLPNVEYVEEDRIVTSQAVPNDGYYLSATSGGTTYPGLWGMWPVTQAASSPSPGGTGNYGADFQTAWDTTTGTGVVVAVVDTGITAHPDIVGTGGTVAPATGNLVSSGYNFISDCRVRGTCAPTLSAASAVVAASPDASDTGDYLTLADCTTAGSYFSGLCPVDALGNTIQQDSTWHGTHVAGTIAAIGNNAQGVIGGAYTAKILPVRALGKGGGKMSDMAEAIMWAAGVHPTIANPNPAKVINLSLGGPGVCGLTEQTAIDAAVGAGAVVVVAAGNAGLDVAGFSPASCNNVITVAATGRDGSRTVYSNFSSPAGTLNPKYVTLAAQGSEITTPVSTFDPGILSTLNAGLTTPAAPGYAFYQGTSMATPHVAAAVALMLARNPELIPAQVKTILSSSASLTAFPAFKASWATWDCALQGNCGAGILNAKLAVQNSIQPLSSNVSPLNFGAVASATGNNGTVTLTNSSPATVKLGTTTITGSNAAFFAVGADTCQGQVIVPNATCQLTVSYAPTFGGVHSATLTVPTTAAGVATTVGLAGTAGATLTEGNPTLTAPTVTAGSSTTVSVTFSNNNPWPVLTGALSFSRPSMMAASSDGCSNITIAAGGNCAATITISPTVGGAYSGTVSLSPTSGGAPAVVTISGLANAAPNSGGGGGGCSVMPFGAEPDVSLLLAMLAVAAYWLRRRAIRGTW